jgi:GLPGLI family protein
MGYLLNYLTIVLILTSNPLPDKSIDFSLKEKEGEVKYYMKVLREGHRNFSIYFRGDETLEVMDNPNDTVLMAEDRRLTTLVKPYSSFYFNRTLMQGMKMKKLGENRYIRTNTIETIEEWTMLPDTLTIDGYLCHKATKMSTHWGYELIAWYCPYLGIRAAPKEYKDLPGILIRSNQCKLIELNLKNLEQTTLIPNQGELISNKKYLNSKSDTQLYESSYKPK